MQRGDGQLGRLVRPHQHPAPFPPEQPLDHTPPRPEGPADLPLFAGGLGARATDKSQRFDKTLPHHVAGVLPEPDQQGHGVEGVQEAQRGGGDGPHVLVRVVQVTDQRGDGGRADRRQDPRQLIPLLPGQRRSGAQRNHQRSNDPGAVMRQRVPRPLMDRLVRTPEVRDRLGQKAPLPERGKNLLQQHQGEECFEHSQHRGGRPRGLADVRDPEELM